MKLWPSKTKNRLLGTCPQKLYKASKDTGAAMAVRQIAGLYRLEKKVRHIPMEKNRQWRQRYARPVLDKLWQSLELQKDARRAP